VYDNRYKKRLVQPPGRGSPTTSQSNFFHSLLFVGDVLERPGHFCGVLQFGRSHYGISSAVSGDLWEDGTSLNFQASDPKMNGWNLNINLK